MNNSAGAERLRCALRELADGCVVGRPDTTADVLWWLSQRALSRASGGRTSSRDAVMDLVGSFHEKLVRTALRHGGLRALVLEWTAKADGELLTFVTKMLFHLAVDAHPNWKTVRGLRLLVSAAVAKGAPPPGTTVFRPDTLFKGGRLNSALVADACRSVWLDAPASAALPWSSEALTPVLLRTWELEPVMVSSTRGEVGSELEPRDPAAPESSTDVFESLETTRALVQALTEAFTPDEHALLVARDAGFKESARQLGVGVATVHKQFQELVARVRPIVVALGAGPDHLEQAVAVLRERLATSPKRAEREERSRVQPAREPAAKRAANGR